MRLLTRRMRSQPEARTLQTSSPATGTRNRRPRCTSTRQTDAFMVTLTRPIGPAQGKSFQTLDARTLGRPVHLLEQFTRQFGEDLAELFRVSLNRRYGAAFEIGTIQVATAGVEPPSGQRWLTYQVGDGQISYAIERRVLLCILGYRYGTLNAPAAQAERSEAFAL